MNSEPFTMKQIHITECPRDAQQGLPYTIPVEARAKYINELMTAGFDVLDFGSFVSPKAVPQMANSQQVLELIDKTNSSTELLVIVGNERGANEAVTFDKIDIVGFPFSISDTFLQKNINSNINAVFNTVKSLQKICTEGKKKFRVYISMAFGNPYGDAWNDGILLNSIQQLVDEGVNIITLSDTIGLGDATTIARLYKKFNEQFNNIELGLHLHTKPAEALEKIEAAWNAGCRHFDGVINGFGGCPMTGYELLGNVNTLTILQFLREKNIIHQLDENKILEIANKYPDFKELK